MNDLLTEFLLEVLKNQSERAGRAVLYPDAEKEADTHSFDLVRAEDWAG